MNFNTKTNFWQNDFLFLEKRNLFKQSLPGEKTLNGVGIVVPGHVASEIQEELDSAQDVNPDTGLEKNEKPEIQKPEGATAEKIDETFRQGKSTFESNRTDEFLKLYHGKGLFSTDKIKHNLGSIVRNKSVLSAFSSNIEADNWLDREVDKAQWWGKKAVARAFAVRNNINKHGRIEHARWSSKVDVLTEIKKELEFRQEHELGLIAEMENERSRWGKYINPMFYADVAGSVKSNIEGKWEHLRGSQAGQEQITAVASVNAALAGATSLLKNAEKKSVFWDTRIENAKKKKERNERDTRNEERVDRFFGGSKGLGASQKAEIDEKINAMYRQREETSWEDTFVNAYDEKDWRRAVENGTFDKDLGTAKKKLKTMEDMQTEGNEAPALARQKQYVLAMENSLHARINDTIKKNATYAQDPKRSARALFKTLDRISWSRKNIRIAEGEIGQEKERIRKQNDLVKLQEFLGKQVQGLYVGDNISINWLDKDFSANFLRKERDELGSLGKKGWNVLENDIDTKTITLKNKAENTDIADAEISINIKKGSVDIKRWYDVNDNIVKKNSGNLKVKTKGLRILRGFTRKS